MISMEKWTVLTVIRIKMPVGCGGGIRIMMQNEWSPLNEGFSCNEWWDVECKLIK